MSLQVMGTQSCLVWPPAGIALAAVLVFGERALLGVAMSAFAFALAGCAPLQAGAGRTLGSLATAGLLTLGAVAQASLGARLARRSQAVSEPFEYVAVGGRTLLVSGVASSTIAPTLALFVLAHDAAVADPLESARAWLTRWSSEALGVVIFAPVCLSLFGRPSVVLRRRLLSVTAPLLVVLCLIVTSFLSAEVWERERIEQTSSQRSEWMAQRIVREFDGCARALGILRDFYVSFPSVARENYRTFASGLLARYPGVSSLVWAERASAERVAAVRPQGARLDYAHESDPREHAFLRLVEPWDEGLIGSDIASEPAGRAALRLTCQTGEPSASAPIVRTSAAGPAAEVVAYLAVYATGGRPSFERCPATGYVGATFSLARVVAAALANRPDRGIGVRIFDLTDGAPTRQLIYASPEAHAPAPAPAPGATRPRVRSNRHVVMGRSLLFEFRIDAGALRLRAARAAWPVLEGGLALGGMLAALVVLAAGRAAQVEALVQRRTEALRRTNLTLVEAERQLRSSLNEKEVLSREMHHRVKNNLQVISSLLSLQSRQAEDRRAHAALADSQHRVFSIALVHEKLWRSNDGSQVEFHEYAADLVETLRQSYSRSFGDVAVTVAGEASKISIDVAVPCGLILNELVANALKHAFRDDQLGARIDIRMRTMSDERLEIAVADNGIGLPVGVEPSAASPSLGLNLVWVLCQQLQAELVVKRDLPGTTFTLTFPRGSDGRRSTAA